VYIYIYVYVYILVYMCLISRNYQQHSINTGPKITSDDILEPLLMIFSVVVHAWYSVTRNQLEVQLHYDVKCGENASCSPANVNNSIDLQ
jgi:hypothetical protein